MGEKRREGERRKLNGLKESRQRLWRSKQLEGRKVGKLYENKGVRWVSMKNEAGFVWRNSMDQQKRQVSEQRNRRVKMGAYYYLVSQESDRNFKESLWAKKETTSLRRRVKPGFWGGSKRENQ